LTALLSDLGGIMSSLIAIGSLISLLLTEKVKISKMLKQLYQVESKNSIFMNTRKSDTENNFDRRKLTINMQEKEKYKQTKAILIDE
jgi:hypothetical protein